MSGAAEISRSFDAQTLWLTVLLLGAATYALRAAPVLLRGSSRPSPFFGRVLRYVPAAVMPAIAMPMLVFDASGALQSDPARLLAIAAALIVGFMTRSLMWTIVAGLGALWSATAATMVLL